ncbi:MAG: UDP-N-acetylmuramoylalanine--D-glutamate ligase [Betaproteobacteria bacterium RBG_16_58_11]|nr:MAG: UDP-N-acetylmuramoylalanine--D-glutamate ligase [Betaproteobacteria bacterium RBG_16_58_11]
MNVMGKKVLVLGLGDTGLSMATWLTRHGARVRAADSRANPPHADRLKRQLPQAEIITGGFNADCFKDIDLIAISPGVPLSESMLANALQRGVPVVGDVELFAQALAPRQAKVIAITGANGKSTVTALCGAMCIEAGLNTVVAGNIGLPVLDALSVIENGEAMPDVFVLELSSFQLETTASLNADAATVLNVTQDHMDRYAGMDDYAAAKARVFLGNGVQILNREDAYSRAMALPGRRIETFGLDAPANDADWGMLNQAGQDWLAHGSQALLNASEVPMAGRHNAANALAALALCQAIGLPLAPLLVALRAFKGLPHRVQKVAEVAGVTFYDDSKGTNVGATVAALNGMREPVVLIAGGDGKGQDFAPLKEACAKQARAAVLIGRDAARIEAAISGCGVPLHHAKTMDEAVGMAYQAALAGDAVLLSPACASFDMFRNYEHRAQVFIAAVQKLQQERAA